MISGLQDVAFKFGLSYDTLRGYARYFTSLFYWKSWKCWSATYRSQPQRFFYGHNSIQVSPQRETIRLLALWVFHRLDELECLLSPTVERDMILFRPKLTIPMDSLFEGQSIWLLIKKLITVSLAIFMQCQDKLCHLFWIVGANTHSGSSFLRNDKLLFSWGILTALLMLPIKLTCCAAPASYVVANLYNGSEHDNLTLRAPSGDTRLEFIHQYSTVRVTCPRNFRMWLPLLSVVAAQSFRWWVKSIVEAEALRPLRTTDPFTCIVLRLIPLNVFGLTARRPYIRVHGDWNIGLPGTWISECWH